MAAGARFDRENYLWRRGLFNKHFGLNKYLKAKCDRTQRDAGYVAANCELRELDKKLWLRGVGSVSITDDGIRWLADKRAHKIDRFIRRALRVSDIENVAKKVELMCEFHNMEFPIEIKKSDTPDDIIKKYLGGMARVSCPKWWRRQLRKKIIRHAESILREEGFVRFKKAAYISNWAFRRWQGSQRRNAATLQQLDAVNEEGEAVTLAECAEASVSNPKNRVAELIVRSKGYEAIADSDNWHGLFLTLTCPSKFHAQKHGGGKNPKFNGATPVEAMQHLNKMWQLIRAKWARNGIRCFGFRVCEPHHDGTPHFHMALFLNPELADLAKKIFAAYALLIDGEEEGAKEHRCKCVDIDKGKGTLTGYLLKYITKNITGDGVDLDFEGDVDGQEGAARVRAWASIWGIRQFQQIGVTPVTVWRELRKRSGLFEEHEAVPQEVREIKLAAESQDWASFCRLMGGALCKRVDLILRPYYLEVCNKFNQYGDDVKRLIGLGMAFKKKFISTRAHVWHIAAKVFEQVAAQPPPLDLCQ